jgi:hypothetical protein
MKRILFICFFSLLTIKMFCQVTPPAYQARRISAYELFTLRDKLIDSISHDTSLQGNRNTVLASQAAVKAYIDKRKNYNRPVFGQNGIVNINDSTIGLQGYHADPGQREFYGWDGGTFGLHTFPAGGGGGGDSSYAISMTYAQFQAATGLPTDNVYINVTDSLRHGLFRYVGTVADQSLDNGGIDIVTADLQRWRRVFPEGTTLYATWFGAIPNDPAAAAGNVAAVRAMRSVASSRQIIYVGGLNATWYFNDSIHFRSTFNWRANVYVGPGNLQFTSGFGFGFEGGYTHDFMYPTGRFIGPNTPPATRDSAAYAAFTPGSALYIKNAFNSRYTVDEVENWNIGIHMTGEAYTGVGTTAYGSQYNTVRFNWVHHNYIQIKIATYGAAGTAGNWNNESNWWAGQLGRGIPGETYGRGGWFGLVITKDTSSTAVTYGISGHKFINFNFEGLEHGIVADNTENNSFIAIASEAQGVQHHFNLDPQTVTATKFSDGMVIADYYFVPGRRGKNTQVSDMTFNGKLTSSGSTTLGHNALSLKSISADGITGYDGVDNAWAIRSIEYPTETALGSSVADTSHIFISDLARWPANQFGLQRINGVQRNGAVKQQSYIITSSTTDDSLLLPYNVGFILYSPDEPKVLRLHPEDLSGGATNRHYVYINIDATTSHAFSIINSVTGATLVPSSSFSGIGYYQVIYRNGAFSVKKLIGGTTTGGIVMGTTVGSGNNVGAEITNGELILHAANSTQPGIVTTANQTFAGGKAFDSVKVRVLSFFNTGNNKIDIVSRVNGFSVDDVNGTAGSSNAANFTNYNWGSGGSTKDIYFSFGKTATTSVGIGNNGTNLVMATEKTTNGFEFRRGIGFANASFTAGTKLAELLANGNFILQFGGTYIDNGHRLQVTGRASVSDQLYLGQLASDPTTNLVNGAMYYNTTSNKFRGYEAGAWTDMIQPGGVGGGSITLSNTLGSGANVGASLNTSTGVLQMHAANSTQAGMWSAGTQNLPGNKSLLGQITFRASGTGADTEPVNWLPGAIPTIPQNNRQFWNGTYMYIGAGNQWQQFATNNNSMTFTNKFWDGSRIPVAKGGTPDPVGQNGIIKYRDGAVYVEEVNGHLGYQKVYHAMNSTNTSYIDLFWDTDLPDNCSGIYKITATARTTTGITFHRVYYVTYEKSTGTTGEIHGSVDVMPETYDPVAGVDQWDIGTTWSSGGVRTQVRGYATFNVYWKVSVERLVNTGSSPLIKP